MEIPLLIYYKQSQNQIGEIIFNCKKCSTKASSGVICETAVKSYLFFVIPMGTSRSLEILCDNCKKRTFIDIEADRLFEMTPNEIDNYILTDISSAKRLVVIVSYISLILPFGNILISGLASLLLIKKKSKWRKAAFICFIISIIYSILIGLLMVFLNK